MIYSLLAWLPLRMSSFSGIIFVNFSLFGYLVSGLMNGYTFILPGTVSLLSLKEDSDVMKHLFRDF